MLFLGGWGLVLVSGAGGNSEGGSEFVWRTGGLMLYASIPVLLVAAAAGFVRLVRAAAHRH